MNSYEYNRLERVVKHSIDSPSSLRPNRENSLVTSCPISGKDKLFFRVESLHKCIPRAIRPDLECFREFLAVNDDVILKNDEDVFNLVKKLEELPDEREVLRAVLSALPNNGSKAGTKLVFEGLDDKVKPRVKSIRALGDFFQTYEEVFEVDLVLVSGYYMDRHLPAFVRVKQDVREKVIRFLDSDSPNLNGMSLKEMEEDFGPLDSDYETDEES